MGWSAGLISAVLCAVFGTVVKCYDQYQVEANLIVAPESPNTKLQQPVGNQEQQPLSRDVCQLPITIGTGLYRTPRWGFNPVTRRCEIFYYSGCCGNLNNFPTYPACRDLCEVQVNPCNLPVLGTPPQCQPFNPLACPPTQWCHVGADRETTVCCPRGPDACTLPMSVGVGEATLPRFYYNALTQTCMAFVYRGLQGNENNFVTLDECNVRCQPEPLNPCASGQPLIDPNGAPQRCNPTSGGASSCPNDYYCHVGATDQFTVCCPSMGNTCTLPQSTGIGDATLPRWYFNSGSQSCERFTYTGLQGNQNNFLSQQDCNRACPGDFENPCLGTPALLSSGIPIFCSATNRDTCPVNFWCHVGATARSTLCCPGATNPCSVPLAPGTGNANLGRYYYNADAVSCISFTYNGLGGNQNNFLSLMECEEACPAELCALSIDQGTCSNSQTRYAYNRQQGRCVQFRYQGCGGNLNNFPTMADCQATCGNLGYRRRRRKDISNFDDPTESKVDQNA